MAYRAVRHRGERAPAQPSLSKGHLSGSRNPMDQMLWKPVKALPSHATRPLVGRD